MADDDSRGSPFDGKNGMDIAALAAQAAQRSVEALIASGQRGRNRSHIRRRGAASARSASEETQADKEIAHLGESPLTAAARFSSAPRVNETAGDGMCRAGLGGGSPRRIGGVGAVLSPAARKSRTRSTGPVGSEDSDGEDGAGSESQLVSPWTRTVPRAGELIRNSSVPTAAMGTPGRSSLTPRPSGPNPFALTRQEMQEEKRNLRAEVRAEERVRRSLGGGNTPRRLSRASIGSHDAQTSSNVRDPVASQNSGVKNGNAPKHSDSLLSKETSHDLVTSSGGDPSTLDVKEWAQTEFGTLQAHSPPREILNPTRKRASVDQPCQGEAEGVRISQRSSSSEPIQQDRVASDQNGSIKIAATTDASQAGSSRADHGRNPCGNSTSGRPTCHMKSTPVGQISRGQQDPAPITKDSLTELVMASKSDSGETLPAVKPDFFCLPAAVGVLHGLGLDVGKPNNDGGNLKAHDAVPIRMKPAASASCLKATLAAPVAAAAPAAKSSAPLAHSASSFMTSTSETKLGHVRRRSRVLGTATTAGSGSPAADSVEPKSLPSGATTMTPRRALAAATHRVATVEQRLAEVEAARIAEAQRARQAEQHLNQVRLEVEALRQAAFQTKADVTAEPKACKGSQRGGQGRGRSVGRSRAVEPTATHQVQQGHSGSCVQGTIAAVVGEAAPVQPGVSIHKSRSDSRAKSASAAVGGEAAQEEPRVSLSKSDSFPHASCESGVALSEAALTRTGVSGPKRCSGSRAPVALVSPLADIAVHQPKDSTQKRRSVYCSRSECASLPPASFTLNQTASGKRSRSHSHTRDSFEESCAELAATAGEYRPRYRRRSKSPASPPGFRGVSASDMRAPILKAPGHTLARQASPGGSSDCAKSLLASVDDATQRSTLKGITLAAKREIATRRGAQQTLFTVQPSQMPTEVRYRRRSKSPDNRPVLVDIAVHARGMTASIAKSVVGAATIGAAERAARPSSCTSRLGGQPVSKCQPDALVTPRARSRSAVASATTLAKSKQGSIGDDKSQSKRKRSASAGNQRQQAAQAPRGRSQQIDPKKVKAAAGVPAVASRKPSVVQRPRTASAEVPRTRSQPAVAKGARAFAPAVASRKSSPAEHLRTASADVTRGRTQSSAAKSARATSSRNMSNEPFAGKRSREASVVKQRPAKASRGRSHSADSDVVLMRKSIGVACVKEAALKCTCEASAGKLQSASRPRTRSQSAAFDAAVVANKLLPTRFQNIVDRTVPPVQVARGCAKKHSGARVVDSFSMGCQPATKLATSGSGGISRARSQPAPASSTKVATALDTTSSVGRLPAKRSRAASEERPLAQVPRARSKSKGSNATEPNAGIVACASGEQVAKRPRRDDAGQRQLEGLEGVGASELSMAIRGRQLARPSMPQAPGSPPTLPKAGSAVGARRRSSSGGVVRGRRRSSSGGSAAVSVVAGTVAACLGAGVL